jgi:hypothetical protein
MHASLCVVRSRLPQFDALDTARCGSVSLGDLCTAHEAGRLPGIADRHF